MELERFEQVCTELEEDAKYIVVVSTGFLGRYSHMEEKDGEFFAVFVQEGTVSRVGQADRSAYRRVNLKNLESFAKVS